MEAVEWTQANSVHLPAIDALEMVEFVHVKTKLGDQHAAMLNDCFDWLLYLMNFEKI